MNNNNVDLSGLRTDFILDSEQDLKFQKIIEGNVALVVKSNELYQVKNSKWIKYGILDLNGISSKTIKTYEPNKLFNICINYLNINITKKYKFDKICYIYQSLIDIQEFDVKPEFKKIVNDIENYVLERFPMLIDRYENLQDIIGDESYLKLLKIYNERINIENKFKNLKGDVLELEEIEIDNVTWEGKRDGFYPLRLLLQGVKWPEGIECSKREKYLCDNEFQNIFKCSKEEFDKKDKYKRIELKKIQGLF
jgi:hypothetical protein